MSPDPPAAGMRCQHNPPCRYQSVTGATQPDRYASGAPPGSVKSCGVYRRYLVLRRLPRRCHCERKRSNPQLRKGRSLPRDAPRPKGVGTCGARDGASLSLLATTPPSPEGTCRARKAAEYQVPSVCSAGAPGDIIPRVVDSGLYSRLKTSSSRPYDLTINNKRPLGLKDGRTVNRSALRGPIDAIGARGAGLLACVRLSLG